MGGGLTFIGVIWTIVSLVATILLAGGVIVPEWLVGTVSANGRTVAAFFGAYKRCNYPIYDEDSSMIALVEECGRYTSLFAVPSLYWRVTIVLVVAGTSLSLLLVFLLIPSLCTPHVVNRGTSIVVGFFQIVAVILIAGGLIAYPLGWDNGEVKGACGASADRYNLGDCRLGRAFYAMIAGSGLLVAAGILSVWGGRHIELYVHRRPSEEKRAMAAAMMLNHPDRGFIRGYEQGRSLHRVAA